MVCIGDSVLDVLVNVPQSFLDEHSLHPGGCLAISIEQLATLLSEAAAVATPSRRANHLGNHENVHCEPPRPLCTFDGDHLQPICHLAC